MAQIREIKRRIKSITNTAKVTHAMELVAAAKMRKSQEKTLASRPYTNTLNEIIAQIRPEIHQTVHQLLIPGKGSSELIVLVTTDRGLVGGLNLNLFREVSKNDYSRIKFVTVGKKALAFATKIGATVLASFLSDEQPFLDLARTLCRLIIGYFVTKEIAVVKIIYADFISTVKQVPTTLKILPIEFNLPASPASPAGGLPTDLLFEPSADTILEQILPHHVLTRIYQVLLEAKACEHSARMVAMRNATDAANDLIFDLTLAYNQARQEAITKEILDITTAQRALE